ncbi:S8 family serine peptidase [Ornithinimicrobium ciconiae]|uniref:S8 family serine peptidase n=1 Tax=Ornithinimicrobium ciconiae TaxID=2594265 RepID=A0A516GEX6_9MICO|nr:S8 family serine peptidase [Ornithinimicrobium ciconiae]QDO90079.1 S8 family serine peptidase [Ornithinimicrobium ciconiae]
MIHKKETARGAVVAVAGLGLAVGMMPALSANAAPETTDRDEAIISSEVQSQLEANGTTDVWLSLGDQADLSAAHSMSWEDRGDYVYNTLQAHAKETQADLLAELDRAGVDYQTFWINNSVFVEDASAELVSSVSSGAGVERIIPELVPELIEPVEGLAETSPNATEWGLDDIKAPEIWDTYDNRGEGIVVGTFDTGVDASHPALVNAYRGTETGSDDYNWFDSSGASDTPTDPHWHGTHVTGTMVGEDGENQIGVAPGAQFIGTTGCCVDGADVFAAFEWFAAPTRVDGTGADPDMRPHIINNSWGFTGYQDSEPELIALLDPALEAWDAAGIFGVFSAGNSNISVDPPDLGPCDTISNPAWHDGAHYVVGATAPGRTITDFSSRGPGQDGTPGVDITAPGAGVRSSVPGGEYGLSDGTSMAAPHVSGAVALLWSEHPELIGDQDATIAALDGAAVDQADPECGGPDSNNPTFGEGALDLVALFESLEDEEPAPMVERVFGPDRYRTAGEVSELYPDGVDTVYVTSGEGFPDALTGSSAAAQGLFPAAGTMETPDGDAAPVLLTKQAKLTNSTSDYISTLNPANIVILGGTGTVGQVVEDTLNDRFDATVSRVAGENRYETAAELASMFPSELPVVYVASGMDDAYPDALTGAALAGKDGAPVLLTKTDSVPAATAEALAELNPQSVVVLGGTAAVSDAVATELGATDRLSGADRYETAVDVSSNYAADVSVVYIASGTD